jgi:hypothetical protein
MHNIDCFKPKLEWLGQGFVDSPQCQDPRGVVDSPQCQDPRGVVDSPQCQDPRGVVTCCSHVWKERITIGLSCIS